MKAKERLRQGIPFLLAAVILALGLLAPQWATHRLRQSYLEGESVISASAVHPYGEAYEEKKTALLAETRLLYNMEHGTNVDSIPLSQATDQQQADYAAGLEQIRAFLNILQDKLPEADVGDFLDKMENGEKALYYMEGEEDTIAYLELSDELSEPLGSVDLVGFPLSSGTPLVLSLILSTTEDVDLDEAWDAILETYQQFTGVTFVTRTNRQDSTDTYVATDKGEAITSVHPYAYMEAVSADSVFTLSADLYSDGTALSLGVYLSENGVTW
jgi:hypothetical protein